MLDNELSAAAQRFDRKMMAICLDLAEQAALLGEVPVGALVVQEGQILAQDHNRVLTASDPTAHAERLVLAEAGRIKLSPLLSGCSLYVSLEPCVMCAGAVVLSRLDRLIYGVADPKTGACRSLYRIADDPRANHRVKITAGVLSEFSAEILKRFFRSLR